MSKARKARKELMMSDSLLTKIDALEADQSKKDVYNPVKDTRTSFLDIVEETISKEEATSNSKGKKKNAVSKLLLVVFIFLALCLGGYLLISNSI